MSRAKLIITLVLAGEMVFSLPFHTARFFRPVLLDVFSFTNTELGDLFAVYGVMAMLSYFPGGALADRYSARNLLTASLAATAAGGLYMATIPGATGMAMLYGFWGLTSILLFWGALIRATRDWGGDKAQGKAFGILEAGRGFVAASVAGVVVAIFAWYMPEVVEQATAEEKRTAFQAVILSYSVATAIVGILVWFSIPEPEGEYERSSSPITGMKVVLSRPVIWAQAAVIVCAYCGYKGGDFYAEYAKQAFLMNDVEAAGFVTIATYLRPIGAIVAGVLADRFDTIRVIGVGFALMVISYFSMSLLSPDGIGATLIYINVSVSFFAVFGLRGVYFALLEVNRTPKQVTGAAVGMASLIGFTPEIFFAPIAGRIIDATPGLAGLQHFFLFLCSIASIGLLAVGWMLWLRRRGVESLWPVAYQQGRS
ncbi:MAG: MFS transporter [Woeseiaceae bacterium]|nr:MFS transporter [Woeseiaceae bacterium]